MKRLPVTAAAYQYVEKSFKEWLGVLGYSWQSVYYMPVFIRGLFNHLEKQNKAQLQDITIEAIKDYYYNELKQRKNCMRQSGTLTNAHLNNHIQALKKFTEYLRQTGKLQIPMFDIALEKVMNEKLTVLTEEEIQQLYTATEVPQHSRYNNRSAELYEAIQQRDKAMLAIFYGCALRRNEGCCLNVNDINISSSVVHVRKGKGYKERLVPISNKSLEHITTYIYEGRNYLMKNNNEEAFFVGSNNGKRLGGQLMLVKLQQLVARTDNAGLIQKEIGLHTLRHSIATHLLAHGMSLEKIKDFLGHSSLESTQIYTHLINNEDGKV
ncbi:MAG TPA: tyrosine-type recombinase/integrase [Agriterribacter sp.]|nr:tyrosine-type recombinase/integrase [Agriterribacter sp.]HRP30837.1 tyrosine-type recombinase/integrase [Agriterribacter sp.]